MTSTSTGGARTANPLARSGRSNHHRAIRPRRLTMFLSYHVKRSQPSGTDEVPSCPFAEGAAHLGQAAPQVPALDLAARQGGGGAVRRGRLVAPAEPAQ